MIKYKLHDVQTMKSDKVKRALHVQNKNIYLHDKIIQTKSIAVLTDERPRELFLI